MAKKIKKFDEGGMATDLAAESGMAQQQKVQQQLDDLNHAQFMSGMRGRMSAAGQGMGGAAAAGQGMGGLGGGSQAGRIVPAAPTTAGTYKKGGSVKKFAKGGGIEVRGKTRGRIC